MKKIDPRSLTIDDICRIEELFAPIEDPRIDRAKRHKLIDMIIISISSAICGADSWVDIEDFGWAKIEWFKKILELPNGIPSHDTFGRVFSRIKPEEFQQCFIRWIQSVTQTKEGEVIAIDGKTLRRSQDGERGPIHMVSAWANENGIVLGQVKTEEKSNEITAIPRLLKMLDIQGCTVTIDAMGCQKKIAQAIIDKGAQYVLALKGNQSALHEDIKLFLNELPKQKKDKNWDIYQSTEKDHGRIEKRTFWITANPEWIDWIHAQHKWDTIQSIGCVLTERKVDQTTSTEMRYFISSLPPNAELFAKAVRGHWSIENSLHWVLDIAFREDESRIRKDHAPHNMAMIRHIALNLLKKESEHAQTLKKKKISIRRKRKKAGWDNSFLESVLFGLS